MVLQIVVPELGVKEGSTKDVVMSILSCEWPLTAKRIFNRVNRNYGLSVTYQAVHKTLNKLIEEKIISRKEKGYSISAEWINSLKKYTESLIDNYLHGSQNINYALKNGKADLCFNSIFEVDKFLFDFIEKLELKKEEPLCLYWSHAWTPLFFSKEDYSKAKNIALNTTSYILIEQNTAIDKWCEKFYLNYGMNFKAGIKLHGTTNFLSYKNYVVQIFYPKKLMDSMTKSFTAIKKIEDINLDRIFSELFEKKTVIPVTVNRNPILAKQLNERIIGYFKK